MKTSQKILLGATAIVAILILTTMIIIRNDIETRFVKTDGWNFKPITVGKFDRLEFSADYEAEVVSSLEYSVEIAVMDSMRIFPDIKHVGGTLYCSTRDTDSLTTKPTIRARIRMPVLKSVWGRTGSEITIRNFQSDSLTLHIEEGCVLKGRENVIKFLTLRAGDALLEWRNNP